MMTKKYCQLTRSKKITKVRVGTKTTSNRLNYVVLFVVLGVLFGTRVLLTARIATIGDELRRMESEKIELQKSIAMLESDIAMHSSLAKIEDVARNELGMVDLNENVTFITPSNTNPELAQR